MPRGVYARKSAPQPRDEKKRAAKPSGGAAPASTSLAGLLNTPAAELAEKPVEQVVFTREDFRGSIDDMSGARLQAYARHIGVTERDVQGLSEGRLRQNCKAMVLRALED